MTAAHREDVTAGPANPGDAPGTAERDWPTGAALHRLPRLPGTDGRSAVILAAAIVAHFTRPARGAAPVPPR